MRLVRVLTFVAVCGGLAMLLASCGNGGAGNECSWVEPILIHDDDRLTDGTAEQIWALNESWDKICN